MNPQERKETYEKWSFTGEIEDSVSDQFSCRCSASIWVYGFFYSLTGGCSFLLFVVMFYSRLFAVAYLLTQSPIADLD